MRIDVGRLAGAFGQGGSTATTVSDVVEIIKSLDGAERGTCSVHGRQGWSVRPLGVGGSVRQLAARPEWAYRPSGGRAIVAPWRDWMEALGYDTTAGGRSDRPRVGARDGNAFEEGEGREDVLEGEDEGHPRQTVWTGWVTRDEVIAELGKQLAAGKVSPRSGHGDVRTVADLLDRWSKMQRERQETVSRLTGHSVMILLRNYARSRPERLRDVVAQLNRKRGNVIPFGERGTGTGQRHTGPTT